MRRLLVLYGSYRSDRMGIRLADYVVRGLDAKGAAPKLIDAKAVDLTAGGEPRWSAFDRGAEFAASDARAADAFLSAVFSARTGVLAGVLEPEDIGDYVSGLVIGSEFRQARAAGWLEAGSAIGIVGNNVLNDRYGRVAPLFHLTVEASPADAAKLGVQRIAEQLQLTK